MLVACQLVGYIVGNKAKEPFSKRMFQKKQSTPNFPKSEHFSLPDKRMYVCVSWGKKCLFFGKFGVLCLLQTAVLKFDFLPYYRRYRRLNEELHLRCFARFGTIRSVQFNKREKRL